MLESETIWRPLLTAAAAFVLALILGKVFIPMLHALHAGQSIRQIGPKWHNSKSGTPTMGGIIFVVGAGVAMVALGWKSMMQGHYEHLFVLGFSLVFGFIGFLDDYVKVKKKRNLGLTALQKLALQLAAAACYLALLRWSGHVSSELYIPFWNHSVSINWVVYMVFAMFIIVGCVNAVNLTDGIDGLAAGVTMPVMAFFAVLAAIWSVFRESGISPAMALFPAALFGGLGGFLVYNFHPAKVFMGDTGSLFLGAAVCGMAFAMDMPLVLVLVGLIYIVETLSDILQVAYFKLTHGKRIFKMAPIHHHFEMCGWSEVKIFTVFTVITVLCCVAAFFGVIGRY